MQLRRPNACFRMDAFDSMTIFLQKFQNQRFTGAGKTSNKVKFSRIF